MARYIDADELKKQVDLVQVLMMGGRCQSKTLLNETMEIYKKGIFKKIDEQPTADVVPKSEVKWLESEVDRLLLLVDYNHSVLEQEVQDAKAEIAREIFAEIEKHKTIPFGAKCEVIPFYVIAELKKKYTEGET